MSGTAIKVKGSYHTAAALGDTFIQLCKFKGSRTSETNPAFAQEAAYGDSSPSR